MTLSPGDMARRPFVVMFVIVLAVAALLRSLFPTADPPWNPPVGIVWHDEGAWVHNARNKALFGAWSEDQWNPMYIAPVFTGLEYVSFRAFGVGVWQARLVPEIFGLASVLLLGLGVARQAGRAGGLIAAALLGTNYVYVMWNRTALMEGPMVAFMVAAWYCYARMDDNPRWGAAASVCAWLAFFTKAAAAFFVAAIVLDACVAWLASVRGGRDRPEDAANAARAATWTLGGMLLGGAVAFLTFVLPNWTDYRFDNWQMSVTRKPSYDLKSLIDRVTWFPVLHDMFTRMWFVLVLAVITALGSMSRWRERSPAERLLLLWVGLGSLELILHDVGNERRFIFFIPALVGLASIALGRGRAVPDTLEHMPRLRALVAMPVVLYASYVVIGALVRLAFIREVSPNVRLAAGLAVVLTAVLYGTWPRIPRALARGGWQASTSVALALLVCGGQLVQYGQWAVGRSYKNYLASVELGRYLPPGTLVHGKLANGLSLENRIKPVFVGREFGNYRDRKTRDDVRYILTYIAPSLGYESQAHNPVIQDVLDAYPDQRIIMTFDVAETATGHDRAALIDKFGGGTRREVPQSGRAKH
jgi:4-amino-4-deoxy-L-arabinose transferase-like glycosyltransferase